MTQNGIPPTQITVIGIGPGDPGFLTLKGQEALRQADLVTGFKTVVEVVQQWTGHAEVRPMSYRNQEETLDYVAQQAREGRRCVVCAWGDLNVSAAELLERVRRRVDQVTLIPGVSAVQLACARAGIALEESVFITLHQRSSATPELAEVEHYLKEGRRHLILFPRPYDLMPPAIARRLVDEGISAAQPALLYQRLGLAGEQRWRGTLAECARITEEISDLSVMVFPLGGDQGQFAR